METVPQFPLDQRTVRPDLPERYYLDHFHEFLEMIESLYTPVLEAKHCKLLHDFRSLSTDARCLYVRMLNRQGRIFDRERFSYAEIGDIPATLKELEAKAFAGSLVTRDFPTWLPMITRDRLLRLLSLQCSGDRYRRSWPKSRLLSFGLQALDPNHPSSSELMARYVLQGRCEEISYLLFLYFGRREEGLSRFTLRDLGVVHTARFKRQFKPRFTDRKSALSSWFYCRKLHQVQSLPQDELKHLAAEVPQWPIAVDTEADILRQQALYRLGEQAERYGDIDVAEHIYSHAEGWPSSERRARLAYARGERDNVAAMLSEMLDNPACEEELLFAQDFQARKYGRKRTALITDLLRSGPERGIDESYRDMPEEGVANWYRARGARVYYSENRFWRRLFGVIFWELLFNRENAALHNNFEKRPRDLDNGTFYHRQEADIEQVLLSFDDVNGLHRRLLNTVAREYGKANSIFRWTPDILDMLRDCLFALPTSGLAEMMRRMARDFRGNCSGYPDLVVIEKSSARFVEVKAEGDQLRRNQLKQITALERAGIPVTVDRIKWALDPDQSYVVVDIETTGRRGGSNRITEIGAVRMRGNKIIDTWHHLINPGRSIPKSITRLTGIEDRMVANAPRFAEIADSLSQYSEGCIFVAHNVRFDYGFICDEFRRLDQSFYRPTFCTVSGMRRWYPGLASYSLGNLCRELDISLEQHHRALCDARAAAELLVLINKRRAAC